MYIHLNMCKQKSDVKLLLLKNDTWNNLTVSKKKWAQAHLKMLSTKCVYKSYMFNKYVYTRFGFW